MRLREFFLNEFHEYAFYTHTTSDTHSGVNTNIKKKVDIDDVLMQTLKKVLNGKGIHILEKDHHFTKSHSEMIGVTHKAHDLSSLERVAQDYFLKGNDHESHRREFRLEVSDYFHRFGREKVSTLMEKLKSSIEFMFKSLGFATFVKMKIDSEMVCIQIILGHHTRKLSYKDLLKKL